MDERSRYIHLDALLMGQGMLEVKVENAPLADIQTLVDGDKRSVIGEAIYEKNFKESSWMCGC